MPLVETKALSKRFGGVNAVDSVDFSLAEGELRCLIGPNGAGKSTFFKMLTGQIAPSAGSIKFRGRDVTYAKSHFISRLGIGIKTQVPSVFDGLAVRENLYISAIRNHRAARARSLVDSVLCQVGLTDLADCIVGQLAHGQRQLVEIGAVLAQEPDLILLDEPAAGLTHNEVLRTAAMIKEINKKSALVVVEHDMQFIRLIASTVTVFSRGRILVEDHVDTVLANHAVREVYLGKRIA